MASIHPSPQSQEDVTPPVPLSSTYHESFGRQPRNDYFGNIIPNSYWTRANKYTVDQSGPSNEDEELCDSDGSSVEAPSFDDDNSVGTVIPEDEDYAVIRVAVHVEVVTRVFERHGVIPGSETPSSDGHLWPPPPIFQRTAGELIDADYTLVRVALQGHGTVDLDEMVGNILQVPSITSLNDGSWEILVRKAYLPALQGKLRDSPIRLTLDSEYCPLEPLREDVECLGLENARELYAFWLLERAIRIVRKPRPLHECTTSMS
ncbi:hypothetical protein LTR41_011241 [Exophiala xenobiotica]|nr:hypothetical protein LTR41_011241 [Exophiala xenobiotica]KAK5550930.1 hypothetical protein LTR46_011073 [Exophiala xenobiotica]